jgi:hypothetical protein
LGGPCGCLCPIKSLFDLKFIVLKQPSGLGQGRSSSFVD